MSIIHNTDTINATNNLTILNTQWPNTIISDNYTLTNGTSINDFELGIRTLKTNSSFINIYNNFGETNKTLLSNASSNVNWGFISTQSKKSVIVETIDNITISTDLNNGDTINGVVLTDGDRVLVYNQTDPTENGIYIVDTTPYRSLDFDTGFAAASTYVFSQTTNIFYICTSISGSDIVDTDPITFELATLFTHTNSNIITRINNSDRLINLIQNNNSGIIYLTSGTYTIPNISLLLTGDNRIIQGTGLSTIQQSGSNTTLLNIANSYTNILIENITFDLNTNGLTAIDLEDCSDITIKNCKFNGISASSNEYIKIYTASININIIDCIFDMNSTSKPAINCSGEGQNILIDNCTMEDTTTSSIGITGALQNVIITNSIMANINNSSDYPSIISNNNFTSLTNGINLSGTGYSIVTNNLFNSCTNGILSSQSSIISSNSFNNVNTTAITLTLSGSSYSLITGNGIHNTVTSRDNLITLDSNTDANIIANNTFRLNSNNTTDYPIGFTTILDNNRILDNSIIVKSDLSDSNREFFTNILYIEYISVNLAISFIDLPLNSHGFTMVFLGINNYPTTIQAFFTNGTTPYLGTAYYDFLIEITSTYKTSSFTWTGNGWRQLAIGDGVYINPV